MEGRRPYRPRNLLKRAEEVANIRKEVIRLIRAKAAETGTIKMSRIAIVKDLRFPSGATIETCFDGDINNAIREAGLYPITPDRCYLIRSVQDFFETHGRLPTYVDIEHRTDPCLYAINSYRKYFANLTNLFEAAGLQDYFVFSMSGGRDPERMRKLAISELEQLYGDSGILPTCLDHDSRSPQFSAHTCARYVGGGSWRKVAQVMNWQLQSKLRDR